ncbi:MAG: polyprenol phosphomannose-dependent alpha 1,6 mannosyltransferase MptB [Ardenticatenaceae bacterium]|nr:polyprenol phosphomannose-dependent alpha 1,6 mannosyltransferase MptB [Ardenticatenaceae bacterium]
MRHRFPLWLIILLTLIGYGLTAVFFPLAPHFNHTPLPDIRSFTPSLGLGLLYALGLLLLYWLYWQASRQAPRLWLILATAVLFALPLLITFPFNATDVYRYFIRGRVSSIYGENPFTQPPSAFTQDPFWQLAGEWSSETSPYGPIWEMTATAVTALAQNYLYIALLLFKLIGLLTHLLIALLIWHLLAGRPLAARQRAALLWAWNPALLFTFVVDAHNDGLMLLWLLLGYWLAQFGPRRWPPAVRLALGFTAICLAPLTKPIGLLALPFFFLAFWRQLGPPERGRGAGERLHFLLLSIVGGLAVLIVAFLPFGSPLALAARLLREAGEGGGFSVTTLLLLLNQRLQWGLSWGLLTNLLRVVAGVWGLWLLWRTWNGRSPHRAVANIFNLYILQALNFRIWYSVWAVPFLLLAVEEQESGGELPDYPITDSRLRSGLTFLLTAQLSVLIYGHLRVYALAGDHFPAHLLGVPFTFGLPVLVGWYYGRFRS